jgi:hypothetical protein
MKVCNLKARRNKSKSYERWFVASAKGLKNKWALKAMCVTLVKALVLKKIRYSTKRLNVTPAKATASSFKASANFVVVEVFFKKNNK